MDHFFDILDRDEYEKVVISLLAVLVAVRPNVMNASKPKRNIIIG